jgi:hypothetical protein
LALPFGPLSLQSFGAFFYKTIEGIEASFTRATIIIIHPQNQRMILSVFSFLLLAEGNPKSQKGQGHNV